MEFGITQPAGKAVKGQRFIIMVFYALADLVNNDLYLFLPFVHVFLLLFQPPCNHYKDPESVPLDFTCGYFVFLVLSD